MEKGSYLLELARYVVLNNPFRAGMVKEVGEWPWSSYRVMIGASPAPDWLETDWLPGQFDPNRERAREKYADFVRAGVGLPSQWGDLRKQIFLGSEAFVTRMQAEVSPERPLDEVPRLQRRPLAKPLAGYRPEHEDDPCVGMALAFLTGGYTMEAIADEFGVRYTTVNWSVKAYESTNPR